MRAFTSLASTPLKRAISSTSMPTMRASPIASRSPGGSAASGSTGEERRAEATARAIRALRRSSPFVRPSSDPIATRVASAADVSLEAARRAAPYTPDQWSCPCRTYGEPNDRRIDQKDDSALRVGELRLALAHVLI